jgi:predicted molibdopterin-dependent oxidoreductase YjgC
VNGYCTCLFPIITNIRAPETGDTVTVHGRGQENSIASFFNNDLLQSPCTFCGQCINTCPTGALTDKKIVGKTKAEDLKRTKTICPYCGVGCGIHLLSENGQLKGTEPDFDAPSRGSLCVKGQFASWEFVKSEERLKYPLIKKNGAFERASWDEALGPDSSRISVNRFVIKSRASPQEARSNAPFFLIKGYLRRSSLLTKSQEAN